MGIADTFDNTSEEILRPDHIARPVDGFPETVVVTFESKILDAFRRIFESEPISVMHAGIEIPIYKFTYQDHILGIYLTVLGGAATAALMEEVFVKGAKRVLFFGSCGVLDRKLAAGRFIVPTAAYRDEGTSYHYMAASDFVEIGTAKRLAEIFDELHVPYVLGKTWTTDAFYRETRNNVAARKKAGCIVVEMECASVMAAGQYRNMPVYQFLYAEDSLDGEDWDARTLGSEPPEAVEKHLKIALEAAVRLL